MRLTSPNAFVLSLGFLYASVGLSQGVPLSTDLKWLSDTAAVSGYERTLSLAIEKRLAPFHPRRDAMGDVTVTFGTGAPHRLLVAPIDEPGYVVSHIDDDGYLRVMRLPQTGLPPHYNEMQNAQPMLIATRDGSTRTAIVAGLSIHLTPGRANVPDPDDLDTLYVDLGAHTNHDLTQRLAHRWPGFSQAAMGSLLKQAGLLPWEPGLVHAGPLTVMIWPATRATPSETSAASRLTKEIA